MSYYMKFPALKGCYDLIAARDSLEEEVDSFWMTVLHEYFNVSLGFKITPQKRPDPKSGKRTDLLVQSWRIETSKFQTVMIHESKKREYETQSHQWRDAANQLLGYLTTIHATDTPANRAPPVLYGAVAIGRYVRFYSFTKGAPNLQDFNGKPDRQPWEILKDEKNIHEILTWLVNELS
ncbi:hypothetical protein N7493_011083 [Penicillium malachiteum]|uniref:Uncharacterized protein n=1 Tax=Penicillium malachiteum TaxID=1324776 RepID=A0AAD6HBG7_9EURO|nr:hypothetical protein N7493_011083 [Penicillium malachiteum]